MKKFLTLGSLLSIATISHAQCTDLPIDFTAITVSSSGTTGIDNAAVWVCGDLDVTLIGSFLTVYAEAGSFLQVFGNFNTIYAKEGNVLDIQGDSSLVFFYPTDMVTVDGVNVLQFPCTPMTFDYTNAPTPPCAVNIGLAENTAEQVSITLQPNPADDVLNVRLNNGVINAIAVLDISGREIKRSIAASNGDVDVSDLSAGQYILRIQTNKGSMIEKFSKR